MTHGARGLRWLVLGLSIALVQAACGSGPGSSAVSFPPSGAVPSGNGDAGGPPNGSFEVGKIVLDTAVSAIGAAIEQETAVRDRGRGLAGLADYVGPDGPTMAVAIDKRTSAGLWRLVGGATAATGGIRLASSGLARGLVAAAVPQPGVSLLGPWAAAMIIVDSTAGSFKAYSRTDQAEDKVAIGTNTGTIKTTSTTSVVPSGSRVVVDVTFKVSGEVTDAAGQLVFRINGTGQAHVEIEGCPDAQGVSPATMQFSSSEDYFVAADSGRSGHSWKENDTVTARIFADDEANFDHSTVDLKADQAVKGGTRASGAAQSDLVSYTIGAAETLTIGPSGGSSGGGTFTASNVTRTQVDAFFHATEQLVGIAVLTTAKAAEKFWRSGKCIEVVVNPNGGDVAANSATTVKVKVRHKFEGNELNKPVEAALSGVKSIEPAGRRLPAPATFTYTAGPRAGDAGVVTFKSVSNRGIGQTTVTFAVGGGWTADHSQGEQSLKGQKCGGLDGVWRIDGKAQGAQINSTSTRIATIDGQTLQGTYTYKSVTTSFPDIVTTETGAGRVSIVAQADGTLLMTFAGTTVTSTAEGAGTTVTISVPIPDLPVSWSPGGTCPP